MVSSAVRLVLLLPLLLSLSTSCTSVNAAPNALQRRAPSPSPTRAPLTKESTPDEIYAVYSPKGEYANLKESVPFQAAFSKRQEANTVPISSLGPPKFPDSIPSCPKCEAQYPSLSSCMGAASVFANATSIFNNPVAYIDVISCACTDTFQAVFPQCVDCFQNTDQCAYLGTDATVTGAGALVTNLRNICGLGSALLGGVATANTNVGSVTPTNPGTYTDATSTGVGYISDTTGAIFQSGAFDLHVPRQIASMSLIATLAIATGGMSLWL